MSDGMQSDLQKLVYPVFTLCYLRLVKHSASAEAQQMLAKHRARFVGTAQRPAQARLQVPVWRTHLQMYGSKFYIHQPELWVVSACESEAFAAIFTC